jgi:pimeloyl-ACP methyl ester carboxylesterase
MRRWSIPFLLAVICCATAAALAAAAALAQPPAAPATQPSIAGHWEGSIQGPEIGFGVKLDISIDAADNSLFGSVSIATCREPFEFRGTLMADGAVTLALTDSPSPPRFLLKLSAGGAQLQGKYIRDSKGDDDARPCSLVRGRDERSDLPRRPQTPWPPFPYDEIDVKFTTPADVTRAGTLTLPKDPLRGAAILVSGSGKHDRDCSSEGHRFFWVIADHLSRRGIAVLRLDDRGVDESTGDANAATIADFADDIVAAREHLTQFYPAIKATGVALIGHSEGGWTSLIAASRPGKFSSVVLLGTPLAPIPATLIDIEKRKCARLLMDRRATDLRIAAMSESMLWAEQGLQAAEVQAKVTAELAKADSAVAQRASFRDVPATVGGWSNHFTSPRTRYNLSFDPMSFARAAPCPLLLVQGERDQTVSRELNAPYAQRLERARKSASQETASITIAGLNHALQETTDGLIPPSKIEQTVSPQLLEALEAWLVHDGR